MARGRGVAGPPWSGAGQIRRKIRNLGSGLLAFSVLRWRHSCSPWDIGKRLCQLSQTFERLAVNEPCVRPQLAVKVLQPLPRRGNLQASLRCRPFSPALSLFCSLKDICVIPDFSSLHWELQDPRRPRQHLSSFPYKGLDSSLPKPSFRECLLTLRSGCFHVLTPPSKTLSIRVLKPAGSSIRPPTQETAPHTNCHLSLPSCSQTLTSGI